MPGEGEVQQIAGKRRREARALVASPVLKAAKLRRKLARDLAVIWKAGVHWREGSSYNLKNQ